MARVVFHVWQHWTVDPEERVPASHRLFSHGFWVLRLEDEEIVGVALWRRLLEWKRDGPGLTVREAMEEYRPGRERFDRGGRNAIGLRDLPLLDYTSDPEYVQAFRMVEARETIARRLPTLTGKSLMDVLEPSFLGSTEAEQLAEIGRWVLEAQLALSYDGWTLEFVADEEFIRHATRSPFARLRAGLSRLRR